MLEEFGELVDTANRFIRIVKAGEEAPPMPVEPALKTAYEPDWFQKFAIQAIEAGDNVLVTCKTGAGKTFVGEYQIAKSLQRGGRVFYTTPIKSLSNQKFHDLKELFPEATVGIMTGDIKYRPDAQIIVMTTEILRNLLFKRGTATEKVGSTALLSLEGLDAVVFDEVHYINDPDRGHVWEETLVLLPPEIKLILLSATLSHPEGFAKWLGDIKERKVWLISTLWRAVPLHHCVIGDSAEGREGETKTTSLKAQMIYDPKEIFHDDVYRTWFLARRDGEAAAEKFKEKVKAARRAGDEGPISGKTRVKSFEHQMNSCLDWLHRTENLPAIIFQFSRTGCEKLAAKVTGNFLDSTDSFLVRKTWDFHLSRFSDSLEHSAQYHSLRELAQRGIAYHHSGLLPFLKEILEILFSKGLVKVLFATETFAVGINMPTKTVIFTALEKWTDGGIRLLRTDEYIQMAGRAGRRGKDTQGLVLYLPQREPLPVADMKSLMTGQARTFCSQINFHYDFLLKVLSGGKGVVAARDLVEKSYWWRLEQAEQARLEAQLAKKKAELAAVWMTEAQRIVCADKEDIDKRIATSQNAKKKAALRELDQWKARNKETVWAPVLARYASMKRMEQEIQELESYVAQGLAHGDENPILHARLAVLSEFGFVKTSPEGSDPHRTPLVSLTPLGQMASEVNEGHPFLMTEFFVRVQSQFESHQQTAETSAPFSLTQLLTILAIFLGERKDEETSIPVSQLDVDDCVRGEMEEIMKRSKEGLAAEKRAGLVEDADFWELSTEWVEPLAEWLKGEKPLTAIAAQFQVFEGNLQKALMSLAGLVEEFQALATLAASLELLRVFEEARALVLRDLVVAESLYLRL